MKTRRLSFLGSAVAVAVVVVALAVISNRSSSTQASTRDAGSTTESATGSGSESIPGSESEPEQPQLPVEKSTGPYTTPDMPVSVDVASATEGLRSGDVVTVVASPSGGSQAFAVEARLCAGSASIKFDAEMFPTRSGFCIAKPFTEGTDSFLEVLNTPPYGPITVNFRVGTGSQSFILQDSSQTTITCDASSPCQLVLKMHYPNGFGFQGIPLTFQ